VVGWDPQFNYSKLVYASVCLRLVYVPCLHRSVCSVKMMFQPITFREIPGCIFIATNTDSADSIGEAYGGPNSVPRMMPGTGGLVAAVSVASGVSPVVVGKEGPWLLSHLQADYALIPSSACMIGDRYVISQSIGSP